MQYNTRYLVSHSTNPAKDGINICREVDGGTLPMIGYGVEMFDVCILADSQRPNLVFSDLC